MTTGSRVRAQFVAWLAFMLGVVGSVAANAAHARPEWGPRLASAAAPLALVLAVELAAQVRWPAGIWWQAGRWSGTGVVAAVAGVVSYQHMHSLLLSYGESELTAIIQPASVDGLMLVAATALLALGRSEAVATAKRPQQAPRVQQRSAAPQQALREAPSEPLHVVSAARTATRSVQISDDEALRLLLAEHPEQNPAKRETQRVTGVRFARVDALHQLADEARSAARGRESVSS